MPYKPFRSIGTRTFTNLSGSGTIQAVGNATIGGTLNVTGAVTLQAPASGTIGGGGSQLALNSSGLVVLDSANIRLPIPQGCYFSSSTSDTISLFPSLGSIDGIATIPVTDGSTMINIEVSSNITADITDSGANGLDIGVVVTEDHHGYHVFLITQANGAVPALLFSLAAVNPTMPVDYTYKSQSLFYIYRNTTHDVWQKYTSQRDGWAYSRHTIASALGSTVEDTPVDARQYLPAGGEAMILGKFENTSGTNRKISLAFNLAGSGNPTPFWSASNIRQTSARSARSTVTQTYWLPVPPSGSVAEAETFYYDWDGSVTGDKAAFFTVAFRTVAYCG